MIFPSFVQIVGDLSQCSEQLRASGTPIGTPEEPAVVIAENELMVAANSVDAVSHKLAQLRPRQTHVSLRRK